MIKCYFAFFPLPKLSKMFRILYRLFLKMRTKSVKILKKTANLKEKQGKHVILLEKTSIVQFISGSSAASKCYRFMGVFLQRM